jgi:antitoxin (DNA-binding transcriptional repressor) of toxin-antitoxin stability system
MIVQETVDINELPKRLNDLLRLLAKGGEVVLAKGEKPIARLVPIKVRKGHRIPGLHKGQIWISDDFDDPLRDSFWLGENEVPL